jgi:hypothetical protein
MAIDPAKLASEFALELRLDGTIAVYTEAYPEITLVETRLSDLVFEAVRPELLVLEETSVDLTPLETEIARALVALRKARGLTNLQ